MTILKAATILLLACALGSLGVIWIAFPDKFKIWASDHLDRNKTTGEDMFDLTPSTRVWDFSQTPNWYYRILAVVPLLMCLLLVVGFVASALHGFKD
jgi:hypothetical protein